MAVFASGGSVVTGCWRCISARVVLWLHMRGPTRIQPMNGSIRRLFTPDYSPPTNDASSKCMSVRLFVTMLGADLPYDPLLPELALLVGDHDSIVS